MTRRSACAGIAYSPAFQRHLTGLGHPENPARLEVMIGRLVATGQWDHRTVWEPSPVSERVLELVHTPQYIEVVKRACAAGGPRYLDPDTVVSDGSWEAALRAAGACVDAARRVVDGDLRRALCLVRPPGHHASSSEAMGFCIFNNVAVGVASLLREHRVQRIAVLDYDGHHGNGTQEIFYADPAVLYVSTHADTMYPGTGYWDECGEGNARGTTLNIPLPAGSGDKIYEITRTSVIEPVVRRFRPDVLFISLGFDAFWGDPLTELRLSLWGGYRVLLESARALADELCDGRLVVALEGGYCLDALAHGAELVWRVLGGECVEPDPLGPADNQLDIKAVEPLFRDLARVHSL